MRPPTIFAFGEALIDLVERPPVNGETMTPMYEAHAGGAPANVAVAVARQGVSSAFVGALGHDRFGSHLRRSLAHYGVDLSMTYEVAAPTAIALVSLDARGERSFAFHRHNTADLAFDPTMIDPIDLRAYDIVHVCSNTLVTDTLFASTMRLIRRAREVGAWVSFDLNLRPALWPPGFEPRIPVWDVLSCAQIIKVSEEEWSFLCGIGHVQEMSVLERLFSGRCELLAITRGPGRTRVLTRRAEFSLLPPRVPVVDTTGAGDAFCGALLAFLATCEKQTRTVLPAIEHDLELALRHACAAGAQAVQTRGAFPSMPSRDMVNALCMSVECTRIR